MLAQFIIIFLHIFYVCCYSPDGDICSLKSTPQELDWVESPSIRYILPHSHLIIMITILLHDLLCFDLFPSETCVLCQICHCLAFSKTFVEKTPCGRNMCKYALYGMDI